MTQAQSVQPQVSNQPARLPQKIAPNTYWRDPRRTGKGYALDYKKRNKAKPSGFDYLYLGYWSSEKLEKMRQQLGSDDAIAAQIRAEIVFNARKYLERKNRNATGQNQNQI